MHTIFEPFLKFGDWDIYDHMQQSPQPLSLSPHCIIVSNIIPQESSKRFHGGATQKL